MNALVFTLGLLVGFGLAWLVVKRSWPWRRDEPVQQLACAILVDRDQVRELEEERDRLFNLSLDLLAVSNLEGRLLQVNPAWVRVLRWSRDEIMAQSYLSLIHPDDRPLAERSLDELRTGSPVRDVELRTRCRDGSYRWIAWSSFPLTARKTVFTVARDITERKKAREQLQIYQRRLQRLANELASAEERQNRRLAEILHDTLAQDLFAAQARLSLLEHSERVENPQSVVREVMAILKQASELTRTLTFELFPPSLYGIGLDAALQWLCRSFEATRGLSCRFVLQGDPPDLCPDRDPDVRTLLYQGARELLTNVYKHAGAAKAEVLLSCTTEQLSLQVEDDGCGFDEQVLTGAPIPDPSCGMFGLFNLRERLGQLGGSLRIEHSTHGGGKVTMTVPVSSPPTEA